MISKVIRGSSFYGVCRYLLQDVKRAEVLNVEGVRDYDYKLMTADFERQQNMRPGLHKAVFHGILSFYPTEQLTKKQFTEISKAYLEALGIRNTQYAIIQHNDRAHLHLHIIANMVDNQGLTIKDQWIGLRGKKVAQELTQQYGLREAVSKNMKRIQLERLNAYEAGKYFVYQSLEKGLHQCKDLTQLEDHLQKNNISVLYKYKGQTKEVQGISFKYHNYQYKGSDIDRTFSINNLRRQLLQQQAKQQNAAASKQNVVHIPFAKPSQSVPGLTKAKHQNPVNLLENLLKPEYNNDYIDPKLQLKQKKKKRKGLHL